MKPCLLQDLEPKYEEMVKHENQEDFSPKKKKGKKQSIEPGLFRIKEILASFLQNDLKSRYEYRIEVFLAKNYLGQNFVKNNFPNLSILIGLYQN